MLKNTYKNYPNEKGYFGQFGGRYVSETLMPLILEVQEEYDKIKNIVTFVNKVFFNDKKNEIIIKSDFLRYERNKELTYSKGKTELNILENYDVNSENIYFDRKLNKIFSKKI